MKEVVFSLTRVVRLVPNRSLSLTTESLYETAMEPTMYTPQRQANKVAE